MGIEYQRTSLLRGPAGLPGGLLLHDDFENGPWWSTGGTAGDKIHALSDAHAYAGAKSLHMKTRATNSANGDYVQINRSFRLRNLTNVSFEFMLLPTGIANIQSFDISIFLDTYLYLYTAAFRYVGATDSLWFMNSEGSYEQFSEYGFAMYEDYWYRIAFDFNWDTFKYNKFWFNHVEHDLSAKSVYSEATQEYIMSEIQINLKANAEGPAEWYLDQLFISETR